MPHPDGATAAKVKWRETERGTIAPEVIPHFSTGCQHLIIVHTDHIFSANFALLNHNT